MLLTFGDYVFPKTQAEYSDNFADGVPVTSRLPGMDGGWNEDGWGAAASEIGKVSLGLTLMSDTREGMGALRSAIRGIKNKGLQRLVMQPSDPDDLPRWCLARVNNISTSQRFDLHTDYWQKVSIIWQVPDPHWYSGQYGGVTFNDGYQFNDGLTFGFGAYEVACSGLTTTATVTNNGNTDAIAWFALAPESGDSCTNPKVQRVVSGMAVDEVAYFGTLTYGTSLSANGKTQRINKDGLSVFSECTYKHPSLLRLKPGENTIRVKLASGGNAAQLYLYWWDTWI